MFRREGRARNPCALCDTIFSKAFSLHSVSSFPITLPLVGKYDQRNFVPNYRQCEERDALGVISAQETLVTPVKILTTQQGFPQTPDAQTDTMILYPKRRNP